MSIRFYDGDVEVSVWDDVQKSVVQHYEEDRSCDMDPDEFMGGKRRRRSTSPGQKLAQQFSHWCQQCECAFRHDDAVKQQFVCPVCGDSLTEFDWNEITADERDWKNFREARIKDFEESVGDGYDPDDWF